MKRKKVFALAVAIVMSLGMLACNGTQNNTSISKATPPVLNDGSLTINATDVDISHIEPVKYQVEIFKNGDYYVDAYEEADSPAFVFITTNAKSLVMNVSDIQIDSNNNATITVCETQPKTRMDKKLKTVVVELHPFPKSVTVVDTDGNTLQEAQ